MIGRTLAHYRIDRKLGAGGMGEVYLAQDTILGRSVALKILPTEISLVGDRMRRFVDEAKAASALNHPHIATIHEFGEADGVHFIVMEYVDGETLKATIARGPLAPLDVVKLATQIAEAIDAAHSQGIIHRDIKPSNIMITPRGHAKVLDFGVSKRIVLDESFSNDFTREGTRSGVVVGTVPYMSPEQALGERLDERSDVFSLGIVLYEMTTGFHPFVGETEYETLDNILHAAPQSIASINPTVPTNLERIILRCLEKRSERRLRTAAELAEALRKSGTEAPTVEPGATSEDGLPRQLTRFVGRRREIAEIRRLLKQTRLLTLSGPAGIGKTRLALYVAGDAHREYPDGARFVELAALADPELVPQTVASALGIREERERSIADTLVEHLRHKSVLLVLDNCEHLIVACALLVDVLLRQCRNLGALATSREPFLIAGETVFRVPSLTLPDPDTPTDIENLTAFDAVQLFVDRARAVKSNLAVTPAMASALRKVCVRLEGIPLAIELAAARVSALSIEQIAARLDDRLNLLTAGSRTALPRHQTLLAAIDWSYNLLAESERALFRRLSVFSGGWTLEAAEAVCVGDGVEKSRVLELLSGLVDKSLVLTEERDGQQRYRFMMTLLDYAQKRLHEAEQHGSIFRQHAEFFLGIAIEGESRLMSGDQKLWLERLDAEHDNLRAALAWTASSDVNMGLRLATTLGQFWHLRGYLAEGRKWLNEMMGAADADPRQRMKALNAAARITRTQGEYVSAQALLEQALALSRELGDRHETATALNTLAVVAGDKGNLALARSLLEESLTIRRESGDKGWIPITLNNLGNLALLQGEFGAARACFEECLAISRETGNKHAIALVLLNCGELSRRLGDYDEAQSVFEEALVLVQDLGDKSLIPHALNSLGVLAARLGDYTEARAQLTRGLQISRELGDKPSIGMTLLSLGVVAACLEERALARSLFEESLTIRRELGQRLEIAVALNWLGRVHARQRDHAKASALHEEALTICRQLNVRDGAAESLANLGDVASLQGKNEAALALYRESLALRQQLDEKPELLHPLERVAAGLVLCGQPDLAARLLGAAKALREDLLVPRPPSEEKEYEQCIDRLRSDLGEQRFRAAWTFGQTMGVDRAVSDALQDKS